MQAACQGWGWVSWGLSGRLLWRARASGSLPGFSRADLVASSSWLRRSLRNPPDLRTHALSALLFEWVCGGRGKRVVRRSGGTHPRCCALGLGWVGLGRGHGNVRGRRHHGRVASTGGDRPQVHVSRGRSGGRGWRRPRSLGRDLVGALEEGGRRRLRPLRRDGRGGALLRLDRQHAPTLRRGAHQILLTPRKPRQSVVGGQQGAGGAAEAAGLIRPAGAAVVEAAKADGAWTALDEVEALVEPPDLSAALDADQQRAGVVGGLPALGQKVLLQWVSDARTTPTRERRIAPVV